MKHNTTFVPVILLLILTALYFPSISLAQSHALADQFWNQAEALAEQQKYLEAAQMYEKSAAAEQASPEPRSFALTAQYNQAGYHYEHVGQYDKAIKHYQQAMEIVKRLGREEKVAMYLNNIGVAYKTWGQYDKAIEHYQQAMEIVKRLGREEEAAYSLNNIGTVYSSWGQYDKAIEHYQQAMEIGKRLGKEDSVATCLNNIGGVYSSWGQYDKAIEHYQQAMEIGKRLGREEEAAYSLNNIGTVYSSWGQYDKAIEHFQQALEIGKRLGREASVASFLNNIGGVYYYWGLYDKAIENFQQALEIDRQLGKEADVARDLNNIGMVYDSWDQYDKAIEHYQQALEIDRRLGRESKVAIRFNNIGGVYGSWGQYDKAIEYVQQAMEIDRQLGKEADVARDLNNIGMVYSSLGQYDKAIDNYKKSILLIEKIRKTAKGDIRRDYLANQIHTYQNLASASLKKGDTQEVLDAVEQSRARLLAERIAGIDSEIKIPSLKEVQKGLAEDEAVLLFSNINLNNFILMVITGKEIAMQEISKDSFLANSRKQYKKPVLMLLEKQRGLLYKGKSKEDDQAFEDKKLQADFETAIHYYRTLLTNPRKQKETQKFGKLLHELLIEPAKDKLTGKTKITIMPDGILGFLPFETLVDDKDNYLAQDYDLSYTQSLTIDHLLRGRDYTKHNTRKPLLAMGGAVYELITPATTPIDNAKQLAALQQETDRVNQEKRSARSTYSKLGFANWPNLPGTLKEVNELSNIIKDGDTLTGDKVTENMVKQYSENGKLADYKIIHFATHGMVVPEIPELSAIVLSQFKTERDGEDGYLRMGEIAKLNLAADFVNLSACETGLGRIYGGEGIVGLTQSFLIAGANGLSVSLWQVADDSTAKFMTELYKKVAETGMGYKQAITEVKRGFINGDYGEQWKSPFYWSPFVYYGK